MVGAAEGLWTRWIGDVLTKVLQTPFILNSSNIVCISKTVCNFSCCKAHDLCFDKAEDKLPWYIPDKVLLGTPYTIVCENNMARCGKIQIKLLASILKIYTNYNFV